MPHKWLSYAIAAFVICSSGAARATENDAYIVHADGKVERSGWPVRARLFWVPSRNVPGAPMPPEIPQIEILVGVPASHTLAPLKGYESLFPRVATTSVISGGMTYQIDRHQNAYTFPASYKGPADAKPQPIQILVFPDERKKMVVFHDGCKDAGIDAGSTDTFFSTNYVGTYCQVDASGVVLYLINSPGSRVSEIRSLPAEAKGEDWVRYRIPRPKDGWKPANLLGEYSVGGKNAADARRFSVTYVPTAKRKRVFLVPNVGATFLSYRETPTGVSVQSYALTAKMAIGYEFVPRKWDIVGSGFINVLPLSTTPSSAAAPRFWGLNARISYRLPWWQETVELRPMLGAYLWGMLVPGNAYGIGLLGGPQMFLSAAFRFRPLDHLAMYLKFAPLKNDAGALIASGNYEVATGFSYRLTGAGAKRNWFMTTDLSTLYLAPGVNVTNSARLSTLSLGLATDISL